MKKKFVRLISAVLSAAMTLTAVPLSAFAEGEEHTHDGESNVITTPLDFREKTADENGVGWSWDYDTKTLTLDGVNIQATTDSMSVVTVPDGTEIVLNGNNTIVQTDTGDSYTYVLSAVNTDTTNCDGTMTISGDGVLNAENRSTDSMARSLGGSIILNGGTVNATGTVKTDSLEIHNDGVLNANASATSYDGAAVNVSGSITVDGNGSLNAVGCAIENQDIMNTAILLNGNKGSKISVTGNGSITVPESNGARYGICYDVDRRRINAEISGKVTAYGTMCGISGINLIMSGTGSVYATGDTLGIDNTDPIIDKNEFVIKGSTEYKASESTVTSEVTLYGVYYKIDGEYAKTVVIKPDTSPRIILGKQTGIFKTEEYKIIEDIDMTDIKLKGTVYFDITLKNMSDEEFADARGYFGGDEPDLSASIIKTDYGWVCMVCDTEFSVTYDTDNTLTIKCGDIVSNTVQVKSNANRFNKVTQGDNTNRTVFYTNTSQEEKDNYKLVSTYTVDSESISYNWYSTNSAYSADELGAAVSGSNGEFKLADNIPAGNYVLYCDITYSDGDSTETVTEKFTFTYKECAHENGYSDGKCTNCGALCDHSNIDIDTGKCKKCEHQFVATISTDGSAPTGYDTLKDCLDSITADSGNYVKIYQDIGDASATATLDTIDVKHNVMVDLNGHKLNNIKLGVNKDFTLTLTGTEGSYVTQVYVRNGGSFVIDSEANVEFETIFVEDNARLAVNDGAKVTVGSLTVKASVNDDGTTATSVKLATGTKIGELTYLRQNNSGALKLGNLLDVTRQALQRDDNGNYLDLYAKFGSASMSYALTVVEHTDADHTYSDGTGKCEECGKPCEHSGDINTDNGICSVCGAVVSVALYTDGDGNLQYVDTDELHSLLNEYGKSGTVKLFKDYYKLEQHDIDGVITIDLNGHDFTVRGVTPWSGGKVTFKNSGSEQVTCSGSVSPTVDAPGGTLIVDGDIYFDSAININDNGTVILNAGKYVDLTIKGDRTLYDMLGEGKAFFDADGNLFNASVQAGSDLTVKAHSHTYVDGKCDCGYVCPHSDVNIDTGKCTECEYQYAAVIVKDGAVASVYKDTEMVAAFEAADSDANTGCTLRVYKNYTGSYTTLRGKFTLWIAEKVNVGALTVSGDITVTGSIKNNSFYGNFDVAAGGKLTFDENCGAMGTVSVGAGTFDCYRSLGTTLNINDASSDVILHGGYFIKIRYNGGGDRANAEILTLLAENRMFMTRSNDPIDGSKTLLKDGFATTVLVIPHEDHGYDSTTGKCTICGKRCGHTDVDSKTGVCPTCKYQLTAGISGVGTAKYFDNIDDAFSAALSAENSGCTLTLYKDCTLSNSVTITNATVTLDVNGHSILLAYRIKVNDGGVLYLKNSGENGSIETEIDVNKGGTLINGTADDSRSAVSVFGVTADAAKRVEIYGGSYEGLTVNNGTSGIALYGGSYESINTNDLTDSTPVSALLAKGYAFATLNSVTHLPESIVDGSETNLNPGLENVMVVAHTHTYTETNPKCACGAVLYAKVTSADGTSNKYFDSIEEGLLYADKAENKGCVFTLVARGLLKDKVTLSSGQFTIATATTDNTYVIGPYEGEITIDGADVIAEGDLAFRCNVCVESGSLTLPEGSGTGFDSIIISGGTVTISEGVNADSYAGADNLSVDKDATDVKLTIGGGTYGKVYFGQLKLKDVLASGVRVISYDNPSDPTAEKTATALLYSDIAEESSLNSNNGTVSYYLVTKCEHKNEDGSYAFNEGVCKYCGSEFAASVSYTDGSAKTELFGDIIDAFDKANEIGTATVTLYKNIENSEFTREITVTGNVTLNLNGKTLGGAGGTNMQVSDGGTLTVDGDGDLQMFINVNENSKSVINGGELTYVRVNKEGNAEIKGGVIKYLKIYGNAKISGGKFYIIGITNGSLESVLADGYAYRIDGGEWLSIAERAENAYNSSNNEDKPVSVEEAPIKSASIAWDGEEAPIIYRNGEKLLYVNVTRKLADDSKKITHSDFVNGNSVGIYTLNGSGYTANAYAIGEVIATDGEVEYYTVLKCDGYEYKSNALKFTLATCSHPEDSFTEKDNDGSVYCGICDLLIEAEVVDADGKSLGYADIESAIKLAQKNEGSTVKLISERVPLSITVTGGKFTVDFNGKDAYYQFYVNGGDVTFTSSVKQADAETLISEIEVNGADAKVTIDGKIKLGSVTLSSGTLKINSAQGYIKELSINGGKAVIDDAIIGALKANGGDTVINCVEADSLSININGSGSISIVTGTFGSTTCETGLGMAIASGSVVYTNNMNGITVYTYEAIQTMTKTDRIYVEKCVHKDGSGSYVLDGSPCPYCKEEIVATVSYTAGGSETTDLFTDIYDAFDKANEIGTATVTLYKNIENNITDTIAVTGNVTLELNGKKLTTPGFEPYYAIEVKSGKLTVNGSGTINRIVVRNGGDAEINGGIFSDFRIEDGGNAVINGGKFNSIKVSGEGRNVGQLLADGYAYKNFDGFWSTVAEREKQGIASVNVLEAPIKSASIAWYGGGTPVVYRNGVKYLDVNVTYELADASKQITYSDFVNGNNRSKDSKFSNNWYMVFGYEIGDIIAKDGEVEYYTVLKCDGYEYKSNVLKLTLATCSHPEDSFTEKYNDGGVFCGICNLRMDAQVIKADGEPLGYADIESAIKLAQENEGSTVKLISEGVSTSNMSITVTGGKFTVDFNGKEVYYNSDVKGGDVTFTSSTEQADAENLLSTIKVNGADAKVRIDGKIKLGIVRTLSGTLTVNSTDGYIGELSTEGGKTDIDGARIGALNTFGGEAVIKNVTADSLAMCDNRSGGSEYNISIVSGRFGSFTCNADSGYNIGKVMASGSSVFEEGEPCYYDSVINRTEGTDLVFAVCDHKNNMGRPNLNDANVCNYCNEEIVATVSYTAGGSETTDLFSDIYDAFERANEIGTATITLYKDIADSEFTRDVTVTGNVTLALNGKKLGDSYDGKYIQSSDGGELTVNGDGKIAKTVRAKKNSKLTINSGEFDWVIIDEGGDAVISGGSIAAVNINGNAELSGGKFYIIAVYGTLESMLADGYAYKIDGGAWLSIADRARSGYSNVDHEHKPVTVEKAPIKSATITAEDESPIIYRNGNNSVDYTANVTYSGNETLYVTRCLVDGTVIREKTIFNGHCELCSGEVDKAVAEDGEIQYYCIFTYDGYDYKSNVVTLTVATCQHPVESVKCDDNGYVCGICDRALTASVELSDGTLSYYGNRNDAIGAAEDSEGCTLKLLSYFELKDNETFDISKGRFTVDLNKNDSSGPFAFNVKGGDITFTALQKASISFTGVTVSGENANVLIDSKATLNYLVVNSGKVSVDGANIGAITINGGDTVINDVNTDYLSMKAGTTDGSGYNVSIVSGTFNIFTCENGSNYTLGKAIASGSRVIGLNAIVGSGFKYAEIQSMTKANYLNVIKCDHKDENDSYALDGNLCPYCNEEIAATVSYMAYGSETTDLFSDIYDAFAKANEVGTATITLYKDIENSEFTRYITVTGNVTLALNGKKLGYSFVSRTVEVSDGGMLTVDGDGKMMVPIIVNENAKLTVNGGEIATVMIYKDGDAVIGGGFIEDLDVNGNVKLSGGKFYNIEIANGSLESVLADGYAYKKDGGAWLSIAERTKEKYYSWNNDNKPVSVEEAPIKSATLSTEINKLYRNSNANPTLKFNLALAHGSNLNDSYVSKRYGINSYVSGDIIYSSLSALVTDAKLSADEIIDKAGDSDVAEIYYVVTTGDGYEIKSNTVSIDLVDCDHSQVVDPTADKETAGNITTPTYCEICESKFNAKITKGDDVKYYNDLDEAAKDAQKSENEGCTLYPLYNKNGYGGQLVITEGNFTLKYAVRTAFSRPIIINGKAKLTVTGRCAVTAFENQDAFIVRGGDVTFDGLATGSNVTINGGNVTMAANNINCLTINGGNVSISSGGFAEIVTTVSDKVIADYIDPGFWVQDRGTKEWIDIYSLNKATASSTNVLSVRLCPMQIIKPIDTVYYTNGYYPDGIPSLQISAEPWYSNEVDAKVAYQWIAIDENGNETEIEGATGRKLSLENLTTGRYYCRLTYSNAATAGVSMKSNVVTATITECEHSGGEATCTNKAKCEICGAEYGEMKPHSYAHIKAYEYLKSAATCTAKAVYYTSCTECGQSSKGTKDEATFEYGNALGHKYGEWVSNGDGTHTRVCANDNKHTETKNCHGGTATCTAKAICEDCGKAYGEMTAHTFTKTATAKYLKSAATCTAKAVYYTSCADCGLSSKGTKNEATFEYGNALGHKYGKWVSNGDGTHTRVCANDSKHTETKACHGGKATCTAKAICEDCGGEYGEMLPHSYTEKIDKQYLKSAATCTAKAVYYTSCTECGQSSKGTADEETFEYGNALGHKYGEWVSNGDGTHTRVCANDSKHTETKDCHGGKATCTAKAICEDCGKAYGEMTAHTFTAKSAVSRYLKKAATCTEKSVYYVSCAGCGLSSKGTASEATFEGSALGHLLTQWNVTDASCTENGSEERHCTRCDYKQTHIIPAKGHTFGEWKITKNVGCVTDGEQTRECTVCGSKDTKVIAATGVHIYGEWKVTKAPTCTAAGVKERTCTGCNAKETMTLQAIGHKYIASTVKPTYSAKGYTLYKCSLCGKSYKSNYTNMLVLPSVSGLKATSKTDKSITLGWNKNANAAGYVIEYYNGAKWVKKSTVTKNTTVKYTVSSLKPGTVNKFRIRAYNATNYSAYSYITVNTLPSAVSGFKTVSKTSSTSTLSWNKNTSADGYIIDRYIGNRWMQTLKVVGSGNVSATVKNLTAGSTNKLRIRAYKTINKKTEYSSYTYLNVKTKPAQMTGLKVKSKTNNTVTLQWNKNTTADSVFIEKYDGSKWVNVKKLSAGYTAYTVHGLSSGRTYRFRVRAYRAGEYSGYTYLNVNTRPYTTIGMKSKSVTKNSIVLQWNKNTSADGYSIEKYDGKKWVQVKRYTSNKSTTYTIKSLKAGTTYKFRMRAYKTIGNVNEYSAYTYCNVTTAK